MQLLLAYVWFSSMYKHVKIEHVYIKTRHVFGKSFNEVPSQKRVQLQRKLDRNKLDTKLLCIFLGIGTKLDWNWSGADWPRIGSD